MMKTMVLCRYVYRCLTPLKLKTERLFNGGILQLNGRLASFGRPEKLLQPLVFGFKMRGLRNVASMGIVQERNGTRDFDRTPSYLPFHLCQFKWFKKGGEIGESKCSIRTTLFLEKLTIWEEP